MEGKAAKMGGNLPEKMSRGVSFSAEILSGKWPAKEKAVFANISRRMRGMNV